MVTPRRVDAAKFLGRRLINETRQRKWEQQIVNAVQRALAKHKQHALAALKHMHVPMTAAGHPDAFGLDSWSDSVEQEVEPEVSGIFAEIRDNVASQFGFMGPGELPEIDVKGRLNNTYQFIQNLGPRTASKLGDSLNEGVYAGESIPKLADRIDSIFSEAVSDATTIARTEVVGASNGLADDYTTAAANMLGLQLEKIWVSTLDDRTRGNRPGDEFDHVSADGEVVPLDQPFTQTGEELDYPGDPSGSPGNICNCRCTVAYQELGENEAGGGLNALDATQM